MRDYREVVLQQLENLYTDDSSNRFNGNKQCFMKNKIYEKFKKCLVDGNAHLCKWAENDSLVQNIIDEEEDKAEGILSIKIQHGDETYVKNFLGSSSKFRKILIGKSIQFVLFSNSQTLLKRQIDCKFRNVIFSRYLQCFSIHWVLCVR